MNFTEQRFHHGLNEACIKNTKLNPFIYNSAQNKQILFLKDHGNKTNGEEKKC